MTVKMTTLGTVLNKLPGMSAQDKDYYINGLLNCSLLILDDLGMERQTDYARERYSTSLTAATCPGNR